MDESHERDGKLLALQDVWFCCVVLGMEPRDLSMPGKYSVAELYPHLTVGEAVWCPREVWALAHSGARCASCFTNDCNQVRQAISCSLKTSDLKNRRSESTYQSISD